MALWTAIMGAMAVVGVSLSDVGIYLIWQTWGATRHAAKAGLDANAIARSAARAARTERGLAISKEREAAKERRSGERRQLRAYLDFTNVHNIIDHHRPATNGHSWRGARIYLQNYGNTPADELELAVAFSFQLRGTEIEDLGDTRRTGLGAVMPSARWTWDELIELPEVKWEPIGVKWEPIGDKKAVLTVSIVVNYVDSFGDIRVLSAAYNTDGWDEFLKFVPGTRTNT
jgi:hypothetical protein